MIKPGTFFDHEADTEAADQADLRRAYGRFGYGLERTAPQDSRYPILARKAWLRSLNGWLQIALVAASVALIFGAGVVFGRLWEAAS